MTAAPLTEGDIDRRQAPDVRRPQALAALTPHLRGCDPMWDVVVDWVSTHLADDAAALFVAQLKRARELRARGPAVRRAHHDLVGVAGNTRRDAPPLSLTEARSAPSRGVLGREGGRPWDHIRFGRRQFAHA
ncbi:MAG: hypothetical protein M3332_16335 [Actinomycetota bacterium]|nr:hypothetical protein [Actinomycetota bacterium]